MHRKEGPSTGVVLIALSVIAACMAGAGTLLAASEEALLREAARIAAGSQLDRGRYAPTEESSVVEVGTDAPVKHATEPGVVASGTSAELAIHRAVNFLMEHGLVDEGRRVMSLLSRAEVRIGPGPSGWRGIAVPRSCAELTPDEERDAERGLPRTIALARSLLTGVWALSPEPKEGQAEAPAPGPIAAWTRTLETMTSWVSEATRIVEGASAGGADAKPAAWRALVLVEAMRAALRDYKDLGWCDDARGERWEAVSASLAKTRLVLKEKLSGKA